MESEAVEREVAEFLESRLGAAAGAEKVRARCGHGDAGLEGTGQEGAREASTIGVSDLVSLGMPMGSIK